MANYMSCERPESISIEVCLSKQLQPGTFEHAVDYLLDHHIDLSIFDSRYKNDHCGRPAWHPKILLKIILVAYSRGLKSSREMAAACEENIVFMALTGNAQPDFTTIAHFVSSMAKEVAGIFCNVLLFCSELDLIGGELFAVDGHKMSSNAAKEWSGTHKDLGEKMEKYRALIADLMTKHSGADQTLSSSETDRKAKLEQRIAKIDAFLKDSTKRIGTSGNEVQSNITDNESAKMTSSHGVIQGYNGLAMVDEKHQIIVHAEAFGSGQEHAALKPMIDGTRKNLMAIGRPAGCMDGKKVAADTNYYTEANCKLVEDEKIDGYIPDQKFRKRDPRFVNAKKHKPVVERERKYGDQDFRHEIENDRYICPAGKELRLEHRAKKANGFTLREYGARESDCAVCPLRLNCLQKPDGKRRWLSFVTGRPDEDAYAKRMREKIDSPQGREIYSKRMGIIEPVFGNIRAAKEMNRFTLRGLVKVTCQWILFALVHNIEKISHANYTAMNFG